MERFGANIVSFVVSIILARILEPETHGMIAIVVVFINILQVFVDTGLGRALIQKKNADDLDFSSAFYCNVIICILLYCAMYLSAPHIARFYDKSDLTQIIRILSITLIASGLKNVQQAYVAREMLFQRFFFATLVGTLVSAVVGIGMAYAGAGVWALVGQSLTNNFIDVVMLWLTVKWRPKRMFSLERLGKLFSYGWKLLIAGLAGSLSDNIRQLLIGKLYKPTDLAYFNKGEQIPSVVNGNVNAAIDSVIFPVMSEVQDNKESVKNITRKAIVTSTYIMAPIFIGLFCCAETIITLILTEKWLPCVTYLRIFCITYLFYPIHTANLNAILAVGRSDINLKLELVKKFLEIFILILFMRHGVIAIAHSMIVICVLNQIINAWPNKKLIGYGYLQQLWDIIPELIAACIMGVAVYVVGFIQIRKLPLLIIQMVLGAAVYIGLSFVMKLDTFEFLLNKIVKRKKNS